MSTATAPRTNTCVFVHDSPPGYVRITSHNNTDLGWVKVGVGDMATNLFTSSGVTTRAILESIRDAAQAAIDAEQSDPAQEPVELEAVGS